MGADVLVVGGGLAGSSAAIALAQAGHRVALFERHHHPRHKMCGEFLSPEAVPLLQQLGAWDAVVACQPAPLSAIRIVAPSGSALAMEMPTPALGISRFRLDALLLERARAVGVAVQEGCAVRSLRGSLAEGFEVELQGGARWQGRVLLGAWGKRATLDRVLARPFFTAQAGFLALKRHVRGAEPGEFTELYGFDGGYCGVNRVEGDAVNCCLLATDRAWARAGRDVAAFWAMIQRENPALAARLADAEPLSDDIVISNISFAPRGPLEGELLMVGDGAALISPLAGNGQAMALQAAALVAPLVGAFLQGQLSAQALKRDYAAAWQQRFRERLALGRLLQPLFLRPALLGPGLRLMRRLPPLTRWLVAGTRERAVVPGRP